MNVFNSFTLEISMFGSNMEIHTSILAERAERRRNAKQFVL